MSNDQYALLAELAGGFVHEIKNHLGTLSLNLELLIEEFQEPETQRERRALQRVQRLHVDCHRLLDVANDFLRFARIKELKLEPADLAKVLEDMIDFFAPTAQSANIDIKMFVAADLPPVRLDKELFKQVLLNLLLNCEQAMPRGGSITIQAARLPPSNSQDPASRGEKVCISIIDTGDGIVPEALAQIFKPFFSTKPQGSGLGLPITRKILEGHEGTITVESEPGKGTKITILLPMARP